MDIPIHLKRPSAPTFPKHIAEAFLSNTIIELHQLEDATFGADNAFTPLIHQLNIFDKVRSTRLFACLLNFCMM